MKVKAEEQSDMLIIDREQIEALRSRLRERIDLDGCIQEVRKMVEIKAAMCAWADERSVCCGPDVSVYLYGEIRSLENVILMIESGDIDQSISLLNDYGDTLPKQQRAPTGGI